MRDFPLLSIPNGRGFFVGHLGTTLGIKGTPFWVTAFEAVAGLVVEGVFIAMLAQRFFGK